VDKIAQKTPPFIRFSGHKKVDLQTLKKPLFYGFDRLNNQLKKQKEIHSNGRELRATGNERP